MPIRDQRVPSPTRFETTSGLEVPVAGTIGIQSIRGQFDWRVWVTLNKVLRTPEMALLPPLDRSQEN